MEKIMRIKLAFGAVVILLVFGFEAWNPSEIAFAATLDTVLNNCISAIVPPATGGICDETSLTGPQTIAATVLVNKPVKILIPLGATITCSRSSGDCIDIEAPSEIICGKPSFSLTG
jgi:hypothetical protein